MAMEFFKHTPSRLVRLLGILLWLCPTAAASSTPPQELLPSDALAAEQSMDFRGALSILSPPSHFSSDTELAAHYKSLIETLNILQLARLHQQEGNEEQAKVVLDTEVPKLDPVRDAYLVRAILRELQVVRQQTLREATEEIRADLAAADAHVEAGKYDEAIAVYDRIATQSAEIPRDLLHEARIAKQKALAMKASALTPGLWTNLGNSGMTGARTVTEWLVYMVAAVLLVSFAVVFRTWLPARPGTLILFEDLTAPAADRETLSQHLVREVLYDIGRLSGRNEGMVDLDRIEDLDGSGLGNLRIDIDPLANIDPLLQTTDPVRVGPFSLNPKQVFQSLRALCARSPELMLRGSLSSQGNQTVLCVEQLGFGRQRPAAERWEVWDASRERAVQRIATRIAFERAQFRVTSNWPSFELYRDAMESLAQELTEEKREECLQRARKLLQQALQCDPANWAARFHMGTAERKLGNNHAASAHFELVHRMIEDSAVSSSLTTYLQKRPEFLYEVRYNWAVSLSKIKGPDSQKARREAMELLDDLIEKLGPASRPAHPQAGTCRMRPAPRINLDASQRLTFEMLARSARATVVLSEFENRDRRETFQNEQLERIKEEKAWIEDLCLSTPNLDWQAYTFAQASIQSSYGQAYALLGSSSVAITALQKAILMAPDLVDAYNNLAQAYIRRDWEGDLWEARERLEQALRINPSNQNSNYHLGKLFLDPAFLDPKKAESYLELAGRIAWSYWYRAEIVEKTNPDQALQLLRMSVALDRKADYRYEKLVTLMLELASDPTRAGKPLLQSAQSFAKALAKSGKSESFKRRGKILLAEIDARLAPMPTLDSDCHPEWKSSLL